MPFNTTRANSSRSPSKQQLELVLNRFAVFQQYTHISTLRGRFFPTVCFCCLFSLLFFSSLVHFVRSRIKRVSLDSHGSSACVVYRVYRTGHRAAHSFTLLNNRNYSAQLNKFMRLIASRLAEHYLLAFFCMAVCFFSTFFFLLFFNFIRANIPTCISHVNFVFPCYLLEEQRSGFLADSYRF